VCVLGSLHSLLIQCAMLCGATRHCIMCYVRRVPRRESSIIVALPAVVAETRRPLSSVALEPLDGSRASSRPTWTLAHFFPQAPCQRAAARRRLVPRPAAHRTGRTHRAAPVRVRSVSDLREDEYAGKVSAFFI
jgi:hypothetical protein